MAPRRRRARPRGLSNCLNRSPSEFVADASVIINLNATGRIERILRALSANLLVTENARVELMAGTARAHRDVKDLDRLVGVGLCSIVEVRGGAEVYESLVRGSAVETLDDGEAATIAHAVAHSKCALIDERKARRICAERFPRLEVVSTVELLLHPTVANALGQTESATAVFEALRGARMGVPIEHAGKVVSLIGEERAALCSSLPRSVRRNAYSAGH